MVASAAVLVRFVVRWGEAQTARPELQAILDDFVAGRGRLVPGVTAFVSGPRGTWFGASGIADRRTGAPMPVDARMRLESVSKIYTAALFLRLVQDGRLRADGGIVSSAGDTGTFLAALMRGDLLDRQRLTAMRGDSLWRGGAFSGCGGRAFGWSGGGTGYKTEAWVSPDGSRVAVILLNARHLGSGQPAADRAAHVALQMLYCPA